MPISYHRGVKHRNLNRIECFGIIDVQKDWPDSSVEELPYTQYKTGWQI